MTTGRVEREQRNVKLADRVRDAQGTIPSSWAHAFECNIDVRVRSKTSARERAEQKDSSGAQLSLETAGKSTRYLPSCARSIGCVETELQARLIGLHVGGVVCHGATLPLSFAP